MLACYTIQHSGKSFNDAEVICRWLFRVYKIPSYSWKAYPPFPTAKEKGCFIAPCEWMKKAILRIIIKTSFVYCPLNSANPYTLKYLKNGGSIQNDNTDFKCKIFYRRTKCLEASQSLHNPNYGAYQATPPTKNGTLSYLHKIDCVYTVHWEFGDNSSTDSDMRSVSSSTAEYICLPTCLSVCQWVCLFVYKKGTLPFASDLYKPHHCHGFKHNFFRDVPKSKQSKLVNNKKICSGDFGPPC